MPEVHFRVRWPSGEEELCYSPSTVILDHLEAGASYSLADFTQRARAALEIASERVRARYGYACSSALDQLRAIEEKSAALDGSDPLAAVTVLAFVREQPRDARLAPAAERLPVVVIGGGHAGLTMSYLLGRSGIRHVVLEAESIAHSWRHKRWDTFCLVTPNWQCTLPGHPYDGPDDQGFMLKDEIVSYVEAYARKYDLPVREGTRVTSLFSSPSGGFEVATKGGRILAEQVVVATGAYHRPVIPHLHEGFPPSVQHLHSEAYKNPNALPAGGVLVVGTGQSGCQIAEDLHRAGRQVHLAVGSAPRCARRYRGRDVTEWLNEMGYYELPYDAHPDRDQVRDKTNHYVTGRDGGHDIDLRAFALAGMKLYGTLLSATAGVASFAPDLERNLDEADDVYRRINRSIDDFIGRRGLSAPPGEIYQPPWRPGAPDLTLDVARAGIASVIWSVGFRSDFSWIQSPKSDREGEPLLFDEQGHVQHERGVTRVPGLYFLGLPWQYTWGSGRFFGVGRDAEYLLQAILEKAEASPGKPTSARAG